VQSSRHTVIAEATLQQCAENRDEVCASLIKVDKQTGKHMVNAVLHGEAIPAGFEANEFLNDVGSLSRYLHWFACSCLPDTFAYIQEVKNDPQPASSTFFYLWSAILSEIMDVGILFLQSMKLSHLSLHRDGVRVSTLSPDADWEATCAKCSKQIKDATGYDVSLKRKCHRTFLECITASATPRVSPLSDPAFRVVGNCIPAAVARLKPDLDVLGLIKDESNVLNASAAERQCRSYADVKTLLGVSLDPCRGLAVPGDGPYLIHSEDSGVPHCVAVVVLGSECQVYDGDTRFEISKADLVDAYATSLDRTSIATFALKASAPSLDAGAFILLDLQAAGKRRLCRSTDPTSIGSDTVAKRRRRSDCVSVGNEEPEDCHVAAASCAASPRLRAAGDLSADSDVEVGGGLDDAVDDEVTVCAELTKYMAAEVAAYKSALQKRRVRNSGCEVDGLYKCELCPFRTFDRKSRLVDHVSGYHNAQCQYVCSGTKQLKVLSDSVGIRSNVLVGYALNIHTNAVCDAVYNCRNISDGVKRGARWYVRYDPTSKSVFDFQLGVPPGDFGTTRSRLFLRQLRQEPH